MHAHAVVQRLTTHVQDLDDQREALPIWALRRRRDLTTRIETTRNDWVHQHANDQVDRAARVVETAKRVVEADSVQRVADDRAGREYRHQQWLEQSLPPYVYPIPGSTQVEPLDPGSPTRWPAHDKYRGVQPPSQGYGRSL
jgi:hypothetical protein